MCLRGDAKRLKVILLLYILVFEQLIWLLPSPLGQDFATATHPVPTQKNLEN